MHLKLTTKGNSKGFMQVVLFVVEKNVSSVTDEKGVLVAVPLKWLLISEPHLDLPSA